MTPREFIDYCMTIAAETAREPARAPVLDAEASIQYLLPPILRKAIRNAYRHGRGIESVRKSHTLTISSQSAPLPAGVLPEYAEEMQLGVSGEPPIFSYVPVYADFLRERSTSLLPIFTVRDGVVYVGRKTPVTDSTQMNLYAITEPALSANTDIDASDAIIDEALIIAASLMRGEMSLESLNIPDTIFVNK